MIMSHCALLYALVACFAIVFIIVLCWSSLGNSNNQTHSPSPAASQPAAADRPFKRDSQQAPTTKIGCGLRLFR